MIKIHFESTRKTGLMEHWFQYGSATPRDKEGHIHCELTVRTHTSDLEECGGVRRVQSDKHTQNKEIFIRVQKRQ